MVIICICTFAFFALTNHIELNLQFLANVIYQLILPLYSMKMCKCASDSIQYWQPLLVFYYHSKQLIIVFFQLSLSHIPQTVFIGLDISFQSSNIYIPKFLFLKTDSSILYQDSGSQSLVHFLCKGEYLLFHNHIDPQGFEDSSKKNVSPLLQKLKNP